MTVLSMCISDWENYGSMENYYHHKKEKTDPSENNISDC